MIVLDILCAYMLALIALYLIWAVYHAIETHIVIPVLNGICKVLHVKRTRAV